MLLLIFNASSDNYSLTSCRSIAEFSSLTCNWIKLSYQSKLVFYSVLGFSTQKIIFKRAFRSACFRGSFSCLVTLPKPSAAMTGRMTKADIPALLPGPRGTVRSVTSDIRDQVSGCGVLLSAAGFQRCARHQVLNFVKYVSFLCWDNGIFLSSQLTWWITLIGFS